MPSSVPAASEPLVPSIEVTDVHEHVAARLLVWEISDFAQVGLDLWLGVIGRLADALEVEPAAFLTPTPRWAREKQKSVASKRSG
jgi:hypothetical protein